MTEKPKRRKAKFKVGQVVVARARLTNSSGHVIRCERGDLLRVKKVSRYSELILVIVEGDICRFGCDQDDLRPLTKRERGE